MSYLALDVVFLAAAIALTVLASMRRRTQPTTPQGLQRGQRLRPVPILVSGLVLVALTAVFDNAMIASGLFGYAPHALSGIALGLVPVEDVAYPVAAAFLIPALWHRLARHDDDAGDRHGGLDTRDGMPVRKHPARRAMRRSASGSRP
ncbi:hypothetical protein GCM10027449_01460 [Sinomonas notoginsengisoli]|uniref:lycopene cyclase domain-containing protein n=1 Tax=Sinomonas notoginsengisoli TaxID=1457311 RepID=UPI001F257ABA|nr:lycopene cyclase domain-containing protein [Sinomonas notoginsengisoli]